MKIIKLIYLAIISTALLISGCTTTNNKELGSGNINVPIYDIKAPASGKIIGLISESGDRISKEQPLFAIENTTIDKQLKALNIQLAKAEADFKRLKQTPAKSAQIDLSTAQANLAAAQQKANKMNQLLALGAVSRIQAQEAQEELKLATAQLQKATQLALNFKPVSPKQIESQQNLIIQLKVQQTALIKKQQENEAISPCTGIITKLLSTNNSNVQKEQTVLQINALDYCTIILNTSPNETKTLKAGMSVNIKTIESPVPFLGKISSIEEGKIIIISDKKPENIKNGSKADISLAE